MTSDLQSSQILCLEHQQTLLFVELIQYLERRQLYWVRPLALLINPKHVYDLRQSADLLWPTNFFRVALDVETLPVIAQLQPNVYPSEQERQAARRQLNHFIRKVWAAHEGENQTHQ